MPQEKLSEEVTLPELTPATAAKTDGPGGGGARRKCDLEGFPEDCGSYGVDSKPRARRPSWAS